MSYKPDVERVREYIVAEIGARMAISKSRAEVTFETDHTLRAYELGLFIEALSKPYDTICFPRTWWDHFKARWFPSWLQRLLPIYWERWTAARYCPHKAISDIGSHLDFLDMPVRWRDYFISPSEVVKESD